MGVKALYDALMRELTWIRWRYYSDGKSSSRLFVCRSGDRKYSIEINLYNISEEAVKLFDEKICGVIPEIKLVTLVRRAGIWSTREWYVSDIRIWFWDDGIDIYVNHGDVYIRFETGVSLDEDREVFKVVFEVSIFDVVNVVVRFDGDPSEDEVVSAVVSKVKDKVMHGFVVGIENVDELVRASIRIMEGLLNYIRIKHNLFELFP